MRKKHVKHRTEIHRMHKKMCSLFLRSMIPRNDSIRNILITRTKLHFEPLGCKPNLKAGSDLHNASARFTLVDQVCSKGSVTSGIFSSYTLKGDLRYFLTWPLGPNV